jgi:hypothetical protein
VPPPVCAADVVMAGHGLKVTAVASFFEAVVACAAEAVG